MLVEVLREVGRGPAFPTPSPEKAMQPAFRLYREALQQRPYNQLSNVSLWENSRGKVGLLRTESILAVAQSKVGDGRGNASLNMGMEEGVLQELKAQVNAMPEKIAWLIRRAKEKRGMGLGLGLGHVLELPVGQGSGKLDGLKGKGLDLGPSPRKKWVDTGEVMQISAAEI
ncbi:hypothetical protein I3842_01G105800 [Carya illinoinensis]|uniref:Uncharacterized protein n=1 Tax=Carya illinoinensis TaxID=32201 RepID=A0A922G408_CARIL|nr:hypothetical protein I3842_01G105800 [Carya illinoinensis]